MAQSAAESRHTTDTRPAKAKTLCHQHNSKFPCYVQQFNFKYSKRRRVKRLGGSERWWEKGIGAWKKLKEWSAELAAGPKWKTFTRRFNRTRRCRLEGFQYDALSYAQNFDDGGGADPDDVFRDFAYHYAPPAH